MNLPDTFTCLWGSPADNSAADHARETRTLARLRCPCGQALGDVHVGVDGPVAVLRGRRLTKVHTADEVIQAYLYDMEIVATNEAEGRWTDLDRVMLKSVEALSEALDSVRGPLLTDSERRPTPRIVAALAPWLSPLRYPDRVVPLGGIVAAVNDLQVHVVDSSGRLRRRLSGLDATCNGCRRVWYLGAELAPWLAEPAATRSSRLIASVEYEAPTRTTWVHNLPAGGSLRRAALYRWLADALSSTAQREYPSAT